MKKLLFLTILTALILPTFILASATLSTNYYLSANGIFTSYDIVSSPQVRVIANGNDNDCNGLDETACGLISKCYYDGECYGDCQSISFQNPTTFFAGYDLDNAIDGLGQQDQPCHMDNGISSLYLGSAENNELIANLWKYYNLVSTSEGVWTSYGSQQGKIISLPNNSISDITATATQFFSDTWGLIALFCAVPLGFYIIYRIGKLVKQQAD